MNDIVTMEECCERIVECFNDVRAQLENITALMTKMNLLVGSNDNPILLMSITDDRLDLSVRAIHTIKSAGCNTVGDVVAYGVDNLSGIRGCGLRTIGIIRDALKKFGIDV